MKSTRAGTKGDLTKQKIIRAAMYCLAKHGDRDTTFQRIADKCNLSQPLVVHYFKKRDKIFPTVLATMLERARWETVEHLITMNSPREKLAGYLAVSLRIFREPMVASIYMTLYNFAAINPRYRDINSNIKKVAVARVADILEDGIKKGVFKKVDVPIVAKIIHNNLTGLLLNQASENPQFTDKQMLEALQNSVLKLVEA
jgi:AcrR family transcriptional regulator